MKFQINQPKVDIASYRHYWRGQKKIGKTSTFVELIKEEYGDVKYGLILSPGNETGFKAIRAYAYETPTWKDFNEITDELVLNKGDNAFKVIAIDTVDELVNIAKIEVFRMHKEKYGREPKSINDALGGYGAGRDEITRMINAQISKLERAGYGLFFMGHTKYRDMKEKGTDEAYQYFTSNLEEKFDGIFSDKADIIATFHTDREIEEGKIVNSKRWIYFRSDGFIDAGTRFGANFPKRVELKSPTEGAKEYLKAFRDGVENAVEGKVTKEMIEKERDEKEERAKKEISKEATSEKTLLDKVLALYAELKDAGKKDEAMEALRKVDEAGNPKKMNDEQLNIAYSKLKEINK